MTDGIRVAALDDVAEGEGIAISRDVTGTDDDIAILRDEDGASGRSTTPAPTRRRRWQTAGSRTGMSSARSTPRASASRTVPSTDCLRPRTRSRTVSKSATARSSSFPASSPDHGYP